SVRLGGAWRLGEGDRAGLGAPGVGGACAGAPVRAKSGGEKVRFLKKKRRHNSRRKNGHRQDLTVLRITEILTDGQKPSKTAAEGRPADAPAKKAKKAPAKKAAAAGGTKPEAAKPTAAQARPEQPASAH